MVKLKGNNGFSFQIMGLWLPGIKFSQPHLMGIKLRRTWVNMGVFVFLGIIYSWAYFFVPIYQTKACLIPT
jgi:hypothetical protein